ncbi:hypothetical protein IMZ48_48720 [Candidatus Bathyarchaeota archaeon]|nr:hypothetical protein [Candidatus Bathyarchaeota archaeon]
MHRSFDVVEEAPSHDGTPCFSAWQDDKPVDERYTEFVSHGRPKYSIQIYDTTPNSRDPQHVKAVAEEIHKATFSTRCNESDPDEHDRLDVWGFALPAETSEEERVTRCIAHMKAEIVARNMTGKTDFYIPGTYDRDNYRRALVIVNKPMDELDWRKGAEDGDPDDDDDDDDDGPFLIVLWGLSQAGCEFSRHWDEEIKDPRFARDHPGALGSSIRGMIKHDSIRWFYEAYVLEKRIDKEIARYVARKAEHERGEVDWDALPEDEGLLGIERRSKSKSDDDEEEEGEAMGVEGLKIESGTEGS